MTVVQTRALLLAGLAWVAVINGYPLLFFDSGTYLNTAVSRYWAPIDRPVIYGWFLYLTTLNISPWLAVFAQSAVVVAVIDTLRRIALIDSPPVHTSIVVAVLASVSTLPFFVAQIMPDIFSGLVPLAIVLLVFCFGRLSVVGRIGLALLLFFGVGAHTSHLPSTLLALGVAVAWRWTKGDMPLDRGLRSSRRRNVLAGATIAGSAVLAAVTAVAATNFITYGRLTLSPGSHVFLLNRLFVDGPAVDYVKRHCPQDQLRICEYVDEIPRGENQYIWHSPLLRKLGNWTGSREESLVIISGTLREEGLTIARNAAIAGLWQFLRPGIADNLEPVGAEHSLHTAFGRLYPQDVAESAASLQQQGKLETTPFRVLSLVHKIVFWCAFAGLAWLVATRSRREPLLAGAAVTCVSFLIANAFVCGALSGVFERYQGRVSWVIVALATLWALHHRRLRASDKPGGRGGELGQAARLDKLERLNARD